MSSMKIIAPEPNQADGLLLGNAGDKVGLRGVAPVVLPAGAGQAVAVDAASVITLANALRTALVAQGLIKGSA